MRRMLLVALATVACTVPAHAIPLADVPPALSDARAAVAQLTSYTARVFVREIVRGRSFDRTVAIAFKRPDAVKMTIVDGTSAGSAIAWKGEGRAKLRRLGLLARLPSVRIDRDAPAFAFADGSPIGSVLIAAVVDAPESVGHTLVQTPGPTIAGIATDDITETIPVPPPARATRVVVTVDRVQHLPVRVLRYEDDRLTKIALFDVVANPRIADADVTL